MIKYDIITFGSASEDILIFSDDFFKKEIRLLLGDKVDIDGMFVKSGGGGTNAAATFSMQGFRTAFCGCVGIDCGSSLIMSDLKNLRIGKEFLGVLKNIPTNKSVVLSGRKMGRVILTYRGASGHLPPNFNLEKMSARWFYLAPLSGIMAKKTWEIISFANKNNIKIAINPGKEQINFLKKSVKRLLSSVDVLILNKEEAQMLFSMKEQENIFKRYRKLAKGYVVITDDKKGAVVFDKNNMWKVGIFNIKVADKTGAGDAFGSGFVSGLIKTNDPVYAIQLAVANSHGCIQKWGAKEGLLGKNDIWKKIQVKKLN